MVSTKFYKNLLKIIFISLFLSTPAAAKEVILSTEDSVPWARKCHDFVEQFIEEAGMELKFVGGSLLTSWQAFSIDTGFSYYKAKVNTNTGAMSLDIEVTYFGEDNGWEEPKKAIERDTCKWNQTNKNNPTQPDGFGHIYRASSPLECKNMKGNRPDIIKSTCEHHVIDLFGFYYYVHHGD